jgi:hypothetical protein
MMEGVNSTLIYYRKFVTITPSTTILKSHILGILKHLKTKIAYRGLGKQGSVSTHLAIRPMVPAHVACSQQVAPFVHLLPD